MKKRQRVGLWIGIICLCIGMFVTGMAYLVFFSKTFQITNNTYLYIDEDDNLDSVKIKLNENALPKTVIGFDILAYWKEYKVKSGRYEITPNDNILSVFQRVHRGQQTPIMLTVPSVRTIPQLAHALDKKLMIDSTSIARYLTDSTVCKEYGYEPHTIACIFIPNSYEVYWNISVEAFIQRMKKEYDRFWNEERMRKAKELKMSPIEICTLASIIDEETNKNGEKPMVASMYLNRLRIGMPLQADPTVKFALQDFALRRIYYKHLDIDSPYNTYKNKGLPPGPIRIASIAGIDAVLNHETSNYLYMCAKEDFSGYHNFARTYREHKNNANKYVKALNKRGIK